jgi:hypothetical protein
MTHRLLRYFFAASSSLLLALSACQTSPVPEPVNDGTVTLTERADGLFEVTYRFTAPQSVLVFGQAPTSYRAGEWISETEDVAVKQVGQMDVLVFESPSNIATFRFPPHSENLPKAYTSFIAFTTGDWGVLTGQFRLKPADSLEALEAHPATVNEWETDALNLSLEIKSETPVWVGGQKHTDRVTLTPQGDDTHAFMGDLEPLSGDSFIGFVDPDLPDWIGASFDQTLLDIFSYLSAGWGFELPQKSTLFFSFKGLESEGLDMTGGALDGGVLALEIGGNALETYSPDIFDYLQWFFAHEAAHLYQKAGGGEPDDSEHAWMHEGSANTMAYALTADSADDPNTFLLEVYTRAFDECVAYLENDPLSAAALNGAFNAYYACGDFMALMTDAALPDHSLYDFWNALKARAQISNDSKITSKQYFETLEALGADPARIADIRTLAFEPITDPAEELPRLLQAAGLSVERSADGIPFGFQFRASHDRNSIAPFASVSVEAGARR